MKFVDEISLSDGMRACRLSLFKGDLTAIPPIHRVDLLMVSAFRHDYTPTPSSLIGALHCKHVNVGELAATPGFVGTDASARCWISRPLDGDPLNFHRLMCVEPDNPGSAVEAVNRAFLELNRFSQSGVPIRTVALPVLAAGDMALPVAEMVNALIDAVIGWFSVGATVEQVKLVIRSDRSLEVAKRIFEARRDDAASKIFKAGKDYDFFVSYSSNDRMLATSVRDRLSRSGQSVFFDQTEIAIGAHWKAEYQAAAKSCRCLVPLFSEYYAGSEHCQAEFTIVNARAGLDPHVVIYPLLLRTADISRLPGPMRARKWVDCSVDDLAKLEAATDLLLKLMSLR